MLVDEPIFITGMPKSHINLITRAFFISGAWLGAHVDAPDGMENVDLFNEVTYPYLMSMGLEPTLDTNPLVTPILPIKPDFKDHVGKLIERQGYSNGPWMYSTYRIALIWQLWALHFPNAKWIIVRRLDQDIINDCLKDNDMTTYRNAEGWGTWVDSYKEQFDGLSLLVPSERIEEIWIDSVIAGDYTQLRRVVTGYGLEFNEEAYRNFLTNEVSYVD